jgi:hypothetical protein
MLYNIFFDDGLDFLMIYDFIEFIPSMKISLKLIADEFTVKIVHNDEKISLDMGNFSLHYDKTNKKT